MISSAAPPSAYPYTVLLINPSGGTLADQSFAARGNFTAVGGASQSTSGAHLSTHALVLDGTGDNYTIANSTPYDPFYGQNKGCVEGWFYATVTNELNFIISTRTAPSDTGGFFFITTTGGAVQFVGIAAVSNWYNSGAVGALAVNTWTHYALSLDTLQASGSRFAVFLAGTRVSVGNVGTPGEPYSTLWLGSSSGEDGTRDFKGNLGPQRICRGFTPYDNTASSITVPVAPFPTS